jgi:hypothetical protein
MNKFQKLVENNPEKYPSRLGAPWSDAECKKLLQSIKNGKSIEDIAKEHERTHGSIAAKLRHLAVEYYNKDYELGDIEELTGLSNEVIADAIARHTSAKEKSVQKKKEKTIKELFPQRTDGNCSEIIIVLNDIKTSIDKLISLLDK